MSDQKEKKNDLSGITVNEEPLTRILRDEEERAKDMEAHEDFQDEVRSGELSRKHRRPTTRHTSYKEPDGIVKTLTIREKNEQYGGDILCAMQKAGVTVNIKFCQLVLSTTEFKTWKELYIIGNEAIGVSQSLCPSTSWTSFISSRLYKSPLFKLIETQEEQRVDKRGYSRMAAVYRLIDEARDYAAEELATLSTYAAWTNGNLRDLLLDNRALVNLFSLPELRKVGFEGKDHLEGKREEDKPDEVDSFADTVVPTEEVPPVSSYYERDMPPTQRHRSRKMDISEAMIVLHQYADRNGMKVVINFENKGNVWR